MGQRTTHASSPVSQRPCGRWSAREARSPLDRARRLVFRASAWPEEDGGREQKAGAAHDATARRRGGQKAARCRVQARMASAGAAVGQGRCRRAQAAELAALVSLWLQRWIESIDRAAAHQSRAGGRRASEGGWGGLRTASSRCGGLQTALFHVSLSERGSTLSAGRGMPRPAP